MSNRLADALSPYLLQHAANPVDWYPWGPEALDEAARSGKPILLSIGYSACHWCHVMAHESFEHEPTARLMNSLFVNVKVDREERPDLDRIHQLAHRLLTRRGGGWPLTMFLTHDDHRPFFGGTYFPREARGGLPGFADLLERVASFYRERQPELREQNTALLEALARIDAVQALAAAPGEQECRELLAAARTTLEDVFDREHGGFGRAPKFPQPAALARLLRHWQASAALEQPDLKALYIATLTLHRMAEGGLMDQLGGGFARYSVDAAWQIPHFEKMLSDNAALLELYAEAHVATGERFYAEVASATARFLVRDLGDAGGAFHTALDADSEGEEGRWYLWTPDEVRALLDAGDAALFIARHGLDRAPNFEGRWHLVLARTLDDLAVQGTFGSHDPDELAARLDRARTLLLAARAQRVPPGRDDKILTAWNGLVIRALARTAAALDRPDLAAAAARALDFLRSHAWRDGRLSAAWRAGRAAQPAFLDDHVFLADAALELLAVRFDPDTLAFAVALMEQVLERFPATGGGFHFTPADGEPLIHRSLRFDDDATPAGNSIAIRVLLRLGHLLGREDFLRAAEGTLRAGFAAAAAQPLGHLSFVEGVAEWLEPQAFAVLRGEPGEIERWRRALARHYLPRVTVLPIAAGVAGLPQALAVRSAPAAGEPPVVAWVCRGPVCAPPQRELRALLLELGVEPEPAP